MCEQAPSFALGREVEVEVEVEEPWKGHALPTSRNPSDSVIALSCSLSVVRDATELCRAE
jgi:hypothetical protein